MARLFLALLIGSANAWHYYPKFTVNLDLPPRKRWVQMVRANRTWIEDNYMLFNKWLMTMHQDDLEVLAETPFSDEHTEELQGIVDELKLPYLNLRNAKLRQMKYELGIAQGFECTGVLAALQNGTVFHGRNLDLGGGKELLEQSMVEINFKRKGKSIVKGISHIGMIGLHTALRIDGWTFQHNTRIDWLNRREETWLRAAAGAVHRGGKIFQLEVRNLMTSVSSYSEALQRLRNTPFIAPSYMLISGGGPYEGAVLTIGRTNGGVQHHDVRTLSPLNWYLVQTNDDWWTPPIDKRRGLVSVALAFADRDDLKRRQYVFDTLRKYPACNDRTLFTWVCSIQMQFRDMENDRCSGSFKKNLRHQFNAEGVLFALDSEEQPLPDVFLPDLNPVVFKDGLYPVF